MNNTTDETPTTQEQIMRAGTEMFLDRAYNALADVTMIGVAKRAKVARRTVENHSKSLAGLHAQLMEYMTSREANHFAVWQHDQFEDVSAILNNPTIPLGAGLSEIAENVWSTQCGDPMLRIKMSLWAHMVNHHGEENEAEKHIRLRLAALYKAWDTASNSTITDFAVAIRNLGAGLRPGLEPHEFSKAATAMMEGLAVRWSLDPESVPPDLPGKAIMALWDAWICFDGDTEPVGGSLSELDRRRRKKSRN